ncbi:MAG: hypothetical protein ACJZ9F_11340 [Rhodospirillaceae bacterium]
MKQNQVDLDNDLARKSLFEVEQKRGYLMPHHGLLALTSPALLEGYDACYKELTLVKRYLPEKDKEFIWLGILAVKEEFLAKQHVTKFLEAGGPPSHIALAVRMAAYAQGTSAFSFAETHWTSYVSGFSAKTEYLEGLSNLIGREPIKKSILHIAMAAIHTSIHNHLALRWHIFEAYKLSVNETALAEALSYSMFTGSIPNFIEGCGIWREMINKGEVNATEPFQEWAALDQSGPL